MSTLRPEAARATCVTLPQASSAAGRGSQRFSLVFHRPERAKSLDPALFVDDVSRAVTLTCAAFTLDERTAILGAFALPSVRDVDIVRAAAHVEAPRTRVFATCMHSCLVEQSKADYGSSSSVSTKLANALPTSANAHDGIGLSIHVGRAEHWKQAVSGAAQRVRDPSARFGFLHKPFLTRFASTPVLGAIDCPKARPRPRCARAIGHCSASYHPNTQKSFVRRADPRLVEGAPHGIDGACLCRPACVSVEALTHAGGQRRNSLRTRPVAILDDDPLPPRSAAKPWRASTPQPRISVTPHGSLKRLPLMSEQSGNRRSGYFEKYARQESELVRIRVLPPSSAKECLA